MKIVTRRPLQRAIALGHSFAATTTGSVKGAEPQIFLPPAVAKVEIFAECVDRHDDGWNAVMHCCANAVRVAERITLKVTHVLMRNATELVQQSAVKSKVQP